MKSASFEHVAPESLPQALQALNEYGEGATLLAGGQSLVPMMNLRLAFPEVLIDLNGVKDLDYVREDADGVAVGAMTRQLAIERSEPVKHRLPLLVAALRHVGHFQIRSRGTVGGSVAHADACAEIPAVLLALGGHVTAQSTSGETRGIAGRDLFTDHFSTSLAPDEILTEVFFPSCEGYGWGFAEFARRHGDFALGGAAVVLKVTNGRIGEAAVAILGAGPTPLRVLEAERVLVEHGFTPGADQAVEHAVRDSAQPFGNVHGSADYRRHLAGVLARRAVAEAFERAHRYED